MLLNLMNWTVVGRALPLLAVNAAAGVRVLEAPFTLFCMVQTIEGSRPESVLNSTSAMGGNCTLIDAWFPLGESM